MTRLYDFKKEIKNEELFAIKKIILNDGIIIFPTETVYGIGANALSEAAVKKIFLAKGRPNDNPIIVHISNQDMLKDLVTSVDNISKELMQYFWPGPLTIILPKTPLIPDVVTGGLDTVGIRMPANEIALKIIETCAVPIAAPSANLASKPSGTNTEDIYDEFVNKVAAIIDGGQTDIGLESTVIRVVDKVIHILRPGKITREDFEALGHQVIDQEINKKIKANEQVLAPGMKYKHYAPVAKTMMVYSQDENKQINKIKEIINEHQDQKIVVISLAEHEKCYPTTTLIMGHQDNYDEIAHHIFRLLRKADALKPDLIIIEGVEAKALGFAIMNRLIKACSGHYLEV